MELSERRLALIAGLGTVMMLASCASIGPPLPPSLDLPNPPSDLRANRKGDKVTLQWTVPTQTTDRQTVRALGATRICRGLDPAPKECGTEVSEMAPSTPSKSATQKVQASYVDSLPVELERDHPLEFATYAVDVLNTRGRSAGLSKPARVPLAPTLAPPRNFAWEVTAQGVVLTWAGDSPASAASRFRYVYRIYRRAEDGQRGLVVGELPVTGAAKMVFNDANIEWEQTYYYRANVTTMAVAEGGAEVQVEGDDTAEIKVFAHDVFPPAVPAELQAVYSGPGQQRFIDLIWAPVADMDLAGYNVYGHEAGTPAVKLNSEVIRTPAYRDSSVRPGKTYFYSVSAVDVRGNESARSEEASESVP